jgi:endonuclease III related protein
VKTGMDLEELYRRLSDRYDVGIWWPSESPFEVMVGAILTQQTNWNNVSRSLHMLREAGLLDVDAMASCDLAVLEEMVRPTGFYRQKAARLKAMAAHMRDAHGSDVGLFLSGDLNSVRDELLELPGIGPETADSILLFAGSRPKFVAAVYVARVLERTGIYGSEGYEDLQRFVESRVAPEVHRYRHLYSLCVHHCQNACLKRPRCDVCVLSADCAGALRTERR